MPSITSLIKQLKLAYPDITFERGEDCHWSYETRTVTYLSKGSTAHAHLLHELAHALLNHHLYRKDIELIGMERDAWHYATEKLASQYEVIISDEIVQTALDSYRDWLHARSTCPHCTSSGIETQKSIYTCVVCRRSWQVNEARICALRRYPIQK